MKAPNVTESAATACGALYDLMADIEVERGRLLFGRATLAEIEASAARIGGIARLLRESLIPIEEAHYSLIERARGPKC